MLSVWILPDDVYGINAIGHDAEAEKLLFDEDFDRAHRTFWNLPAFAGISRKNRVPSQEYAL